jgi:hypothetical protein
MEKFTEAMPLKFPLSQNSQEQKRRKNFLEGKDGKVIRKNPQSHLRAMDYLHQCGSIRNTKLHQLEDKVSCFQSLRVLLFKSYKLNRIRIECSVRGRRGRNVEIPSAL